MYYTLKLVSINTGESTFSKNIRCEHFNKNVVDDFYNYCQSNLNPKSSNEEFRSEYKVVIDEYNCEGCECGSLSQASHMDCPYGCLHDYQVCSFCTFLNDS